MTRSLRIWDPNYSGVLPGVHCGGMKPRAHFKHTIDKLDGAGEIIEQLAGVDDYELAEAPWLAANGKRTVNVDPLPGSLAAATSPPII